MLSEKRGYKTPLFFGGCEKALRLNNVAAKIVKIIGIVATALLLVLLGMYIGYVKFGKTEETSESKTDPEALKGIALQPFDENDPVLNYELMEQYDFTILEIWNSDSVESIRYMSEMNMFAEECEHRDDEIYSYVAGICANIHDENGDLYVKRFEAAKTVTENAKVRYHQYAADMQTENIIREIGIETLPAVIFINRRGEIMDISTGLNGKELLVHMDGVVSELMKLDWEQERVQQQKEMKDQDGVLLN